MFMVSYDGAYEMLTAIVHRLHPVGFVRALRRASITDGPIRAAPLNNALTKGGITHCTLCERTRSQRGEAHRVPKFLTQLPLAQYKVFDPDPKATDLTGLLGPYFRDWLSHPNYEDVANVGQLKSTTRDIVVPFLRSRRLVRPFSGRIAAKLYRTEGTRRKRNRAQESKAHRRH